MRRMTRHADHRTLGDLRPIRERVAALLDDLAGHGDWQNRRVSQRPD